MALYQKHRFSLRAILAAGIALVIIGGYALFEARRFLQGPVITIEYPAPGTVISDPFITLRAQTYNVSSIAVNGRNTYVTEEGLLEEELLLPRGYTILTVSAKDRFGHERKEMLELYIN